MALRLNQDNFREKVLNAEKPVLVDFYSDTCIPCKQLAGILGEIEDEYENRLLVYKVNVNYEQNLTAEYKVMSAPTLLLFVDGEEKSRKRGVIDEDAIKELMKPYI